MIKKFNVGDLVRFKHTAHLPVSADDHKKQIGVVVENDCVRGCVVSFPSKTTVVSTLSIEVL